MSIFSETQKENINYSTFNLSHQNKLTCNAGDMVPTLMQECIPGDNWHITTNQLMKMQPLVAPVMHEVNLTVHNWFVPLRILWPGTKFEKFMTGGDDGMAEIAFPTIKNVPANGKEPATYGRNKLADYLGLPNSHNVDQADPRYDEINPFPFLAYQLIYFEFYRDQNVEEYDRDELDLTTWVGYPALDYDLLTARQQSFFTTLHKRAWNHDYFTSALPWPQKGEPVKLPLGDTAPLIIKEGIGGNVTQRARQSNAPHLYQANIGSGTTKFGTDSLSGNPGQLNQYDTGQHLFLDVADSHLVDLSEANSATVLEMRKAIVLQQWMEKRARTGSRYIEFVRADFNVSSSDKRLQLPEFCGGSTTPVLISENLQTSATQEGTTPLGERSGVGTSMGGNHITEKFCEEHGFMFSIQSIMPKSGYQQGMPKIWKKTDRFDYATPMFQHVGEQEVTQGEVYYQATELEDNVTFGYIPRYAEYKFINNQAHGDFRNNLDFWTWDRKFENAPALNKEFIACNPDRRIFALTDENLDTLLCQIFHSITVKRPLSYYSSPSLERI